MSKKLEFCPECGCILRNKRSLQLHRYYFVTITNAFRNWPENHDFKPDSIEHLRAWLQCEAGHRDIIEERLFGTKVDQVQMLRFSTAVQAIRMKNRTDFVFFSGRERPLSIIAAVPRSIAFHEISDDHFRPISEAVFDIIDEVIAKDFCTLARQGLI